MEHIAILRKEPLQQILSSAKTIESRWTKNKAIPYKQVRTGDVIWLKKTGGPVVAKCVVEKVKFFELNPEILQEIYDKYGKDIGFTSRTDRSTWCEEKKGKKYCTLIWLSQLQKVKPFNIDKTGYGNMTAWMKINNINDVKL